MFLVLDCSSKDSIHLELVSKEQAKAFEFSGRQADLLMAVHLFLQQEKIVLKDISGVVAVTGEGSFTSSRLGVLCGNVIHFVLGVPVVTITRATVYSYNDLKRACLSFGSHYAVATYTSLPNLN